MGIDSRLKTLYDNVNDTENITGNVFKDIKTNDK